MTFEVKNIILNSDEPQHNPRIVGGANNFVELYPYQVALIMGSIIFCGGSIIKQSAIITAAHCIHDISEDQRTDFKIRVGQNDIVKTDKFRIHENYSTEKQDNDVALIFLEEPLVFKDDVQQIGLPEADEDLPEGTVVIAGITKEGSLKGSDVLKHVELLVYNFKKCVDYYKKQNLSVTENMMCTYSPSPVGSCQGDSGGPIVYNNILYGLILFGYGCGTAFVPNVVTSVSKLRPWIDEQLADEEIAPQRSRIIGGEDTSTEFFPYQVGLEVNGVTFCGGSIIKATVIITAAHCIKTIPKSLLPRVKIRVGHNQAVDVAEIVPHEKYDTENHDNDVALIFLNATLVFNDSVQPIGLPAAEEELPDGTPVYATGWGKTDENAKIGSSILQVVELNVHNTEQCTQFYKDIGWPVTKNMICTISPSPMGSCQGDSGGPIVHNLTIYGVISWGYGCGRPSVPNVEAKVSYLRPWIDQQLANKGVE